MPMQYTTYSSEKMKVSNYIENVDGKNQTHQAGIVDFSIKKTKRDIDIIGYAEDRPNKLQIISKIFFFSFIYMGLFKLFNPSGKGFIKAGKTSKKYE